MVTKLEAETWQYKLLLFRHRKRKTRKLQSYISSKCAFPVPLHSKIRIIAMSYQYEPLYARQIRLLKLFPSLDDFKDATLIETKSK